MSAKNNAENVKDIKAYLGEDTVFSGTLSFNGAVRIDGKMDGEINTDDTLIVGENGVIEADINAGTVICRGKIKGAIKASKRIEIHTNSEVVGSISAPALLVENDIRKDRLIKFIAGLFFIPSSGTLPLKTF